MAVITIKIQDKNGMTLSVARGEDEAALVYTREYEEGDSIVFEVSPKNEFYELMVDDALGKAEVYVTGDIHYEIPFGEKKISYSPKTFCGNRHLISAKLVDKRCMSSYRNLALNVMDQHGDTNCYPHASANVETRGEAVFAARNAIDGVTANNAHGEWPYQSWGINKRDDAKMKLEFGRKVAINRIRLYTRADFPHDNWWKQVTFLFSDGSELTFDLEKSDKPHELLFDEKIITDLTLCKLIKSDEPSPFPALTQIEVYGHEVE